LVAYPRGVLGAVSPLRKEYDGARRKMRRPSMIAKRWILTSAFFVVLTFPACDDQIECERGEQPFKVPGDSAPSCSTMEQACARACGGRPCEGYRSPSFPSPERSSMRSPPPSRSPTVASSVLEATKPPLTLTLSPLRGARANNHLASRSLSRSTPPLSRSTRRGVTTDAQPAINRELSDTASGAPGDRRPS
jgi:hypothetical protein